ncbi:hypothetical protein ACFYPN_32590 [Streptomyces sp. NPDC005576]|uniref:hypothetical protein n=1 Tax=Streptomyces sp. NPDC005576 TaxID=3364726 RepID=UPI003696823C
MSTLALTVVLLAALVGLLLLSAVGYLAYRHPRLATPLIVVGTFAAVLVGAGAALAATR